VNVSFSGFVNTCVRLRCFCLWHFLPLSRSAFVGFVGERWVRKQVYVIKSEPTITPKQPTQEELEDKGICEAGNEGMDRDLYNQWEVQVMGGDLVCQGVDRIASGVDSFEFKHGRVRSNADSIASTRGHPCVLARMFPVLAWMS